LAVIVKKNYSEKDQERQKNKEMEVIKIPSRENKVVIGKSIKLIHGRYKKMTRN
jgi:hypothetical protein